MSRYDDARTNADVQRNAKGEVVCGDNHSGTGWHIIPIERRPAATTAWVDTDWAIPVVFFTCGRHTGTVKMNVTKGSYSFRGVLPADATVEEVAADVPGTIVRVIAAAKAESAAAQERSRVAQVEYARAGWDKAHEAYFNASIKPEHAQRAISLTDPKDDSFGRVFVNINVRKMTPWEARALANRLYGEANAAEDATKAAVKP